MNDMNLSGIFRVIHVQNHILLLTFFGTGLILNFSENPSDVNKHNKHDFCYVLIIFSNTEAVPLAARVWG